MLPEAMEPGKGMCVVRQLSVLLKEPAEQICQTFDELFGVFAADPPYNGKDWREVGVHADLLKAFAQRNGITLYLFFGNKKIVHEEGSSEKN